MSTKRLNIDILAKDKTKQALSGVQKNLSNVKKSVFSLKGALVGVGAGAVIKSFVDVGKEVESLQVRFKFLFGSVEEGSIAFDNLTKFASKVPFSLDEISRASGNLAVVADDANDLNRILEITGNVAAVTGLDFETTASQIQRAFSGGIGAADLFRERGVRALLGFQNGAKVTAEETVKRFEELFAGDGQFANATNDLATTLEGTLSMIGDKYFKFQKDVAAGFFDELKGEFGDLNEFLEANEEQIKDIATAIGENFAGALTTTSDLIKGVAPAVKNVSDALGTTITGFKSLPTFVQTTGIISALLFGKKGAIAFGAVSFLVGEIDKLIDKSQELKGIEEAFNAGEIDIATASLEELELLLQRIESKKIDIPEFLQGEAVAILISPALNASSIPFNSQ
jgi:phage tail tape-measure protein